MDLILKFYINKVSRMGVKFPYEHSAKKEYEKLITLEPGESYRVQLELRGEKINLFLFSDRTGKKISYRSLNYSADQLRTLQKELLNNPPFQFVHVFAKNNKLFIAKPFRREEFIDISGVELVNLQNK